MRIWTRRTSVRTLTAALTAGVTLASVGTASADLIGNNLDGTIDANVEKMPLNVGGAVGTTEIYILATLGDTGDNNGDGCNIDANESVTFHFSSNNTGVATVSPSSATFTSCSQRVPLTVTPVGTGTAQVTGRVPTYEGTTTPLPGMNTTGSGWNASGIAFDVNVAPEPNTAPTVSVSGIVPGASYPKGQVPSAVCEVVDKEDGNKSFPASLTSLAGEWAADGIGQRFAMCSYVDRGGLQVLSRDGFNIIDTTRPTIGRVIDPEAVEGDLNWYRSDVHLSWNVGEVQSPSSLTKTGCEPVSITVDQQLQSYTCSATSAGGPHSITTSIKRDATAPSVTSTAPSGTLGKDGWYTSPVAVTFSGTDATSGLATAATQTVTTTVDGETTVGSPAFKDKAGNTTTGAAGRTIKIDRSAPNAPSAALSTPAGAAGWHTTPVTVTFSAAGDEGSGVASCSAPVTVDVDTVAQTVSGTCTDRAGHVSTAKEVTVKLDRGAPVVTETVVASSPTGKDSWYTDDAEVTFTATDAISGLVTAKQTVKSSGEGAAVTVASPAFTDRAGNTAPAGEVKKVVKVDKTAPATPTFVGGPTGSHYFGEVPAAPTCTSSDATSGLASCVVTGGGSAVGKHAYTATATDNAGHTRTAVLPYEVLAWTATNFTAPLDMSGVFNTVKGGATVPAKFEIFAGTRELTDISVVSFSNQKITCQTGAPVDDIETVVSGSTSLKYDATAGQFQYNWKLPTGAGTCYSLTMTAKDGSKVTANFKLK